MFHRYKIISYIQYVFIYNITNKIIWYKIFNNIIQIYLLCTTLKNLSLIKKIKVKYQLVVSILFYSCPDCKVRIYSDSWKINFEKLFNPTFKMATKV